LNKIEMIFFCKFSSYYKNGIILPISRQRKNFYNVKNKKII